MRLWQGGECERLHLDVCDDRTSSAPPGHTQTFHRWNGKWLQVGKHQAGPGRDAELGCSSTDTGHTVPPPTLQLTTLCAETQAKQGADRKWSVTRQHLPLLDRALLVRYLWTSSGDWDHWAQDRTLHCNPLPAPAQQLFVSVCLCL